MRTRIVGPQQIVPFEKIIQDAVGFEDAMRCAALEEEPEWSLVERLSRGTCACGDAGYLWWSLATEFFSHESGESDISREQISRYVKLTKRRYRNLAEPKHGSVGTLRR